MKNFLIIVLALGLAAVAFLTRPDREEFERYLRDRQKTDATATSTASTANAISLFRKDAGRHEASDAPALDKVEFKDFYLWTVVRQDGKTLYTGVFDHWVDNEQVRRCLPS
jgi:hypothetical protein